MKTLTGNNVKGLSGKRIMHTGKIMLIRWLAMKKYASSS